MNITLIDRGNSCQLVFCGSLTFESAREMEDRIIDALRRYTRFEIDLAGVREIDVCGIHLLGILETVAGNAVEVSRNSLIVQRAYERLAPQRGAWLRGSRQEHRSCATEALMR